MTEQIPLKPTMKSGIQLAKYPSGQNSWYAWLDFNGVTFRSDRMARLEWAEEALQFALACTRKGEDHA